MVSEPGPENPLSWREQAVARSLDSARARAESRVQRFIDAALDLMNESASGKEFTVQEVIERSGQSLRSFYQYFGGKQELLLALFEESVRSTAEDLRERTDSENDPLERLHRFVIDYYWLCRPTPKSGTSKRKRSPRALAEFAQQLMTAHPKEATRAYAPLVSLFDEILDNAVEAGVIRTDLGRRRLAGAVLEAIMFNAFSMTIGGSLPASDDDDDAEDLWELILHGIASNRN
ncbi:MAG: TetR/AcrR family transcriptional regulator [Acidimicrobiales bacterium]